MNEFDMRMKERARTEDCPLPKGFEHFVQTRLEELPPRKGKRMGALRYGLIAAAVCVVLIGSVLAASPTLRDTLSALQGGFEPYSQTVEGVTVTDQGIQVTVLAALADESGGTVYLEVKDLTGDILTEDTFIGRGDSTAVKPVAYDPETHTILAVQTRRGDFRDENGNLTVAIDNIWGGQEFAGIPLPTELLEPDNVLETVQAPEDPDTIYSPDDDRIVLAPEQTPMELEGTDLFRLSSMGFDEQGRLHIQIRVADGYEVPDWEFYPFDVFLVDLPAVVKNGHRYYLEDSRYVDFRLDFYADVMGETYIPKESYQGLELTLEGWIATRERVEGDWSLTFPLETLPESTAAIGQLVNGKLVESVTLSAMSATLTVTLPEGEPRGDLQFLPLTIYLADGTCFTVERGSNINNYDAYDAGEEPCYLDRWQFPVPVDPEDVTAVAIGYWCIPLNGDGTAGPGSWLPELPE